MALPNANSLSNTTENMIDEVACGQLLDWSRLSVPLEVKASLCARVLGRRINNISGRRVEPQRPTGPRRANASRENKTETRRDVPLGLGKLQVQTEFW
jgi:hypothetical protein